MDRIGRRPTAIAYGILAAISASALFQVRSPGAIGVLLIAAVFFGLGMAPVLGAISTELFPTYIRNQSAAWSRNVFEIAGFILGPLLVGVLGDHYTGALGSIGDTVSIMVLLFLPGTWLIWRHLPETKGRELEEICEELGVPDSPEPSRGPGGPRWRTGVTAAVAVVLIGGPIAIGVVSLGTFTQRPEGAAERFLQAVSSGEPEALERYGSPETARRLFGATEVEFEQIEVGAAVAISRLRVVPFRVVIDDGDRVVAMSLTVERDDSGWKVTDFAPRGPATQLRVPSEGGPPPAGAPVAAWVIGVLAVVTLTVLAEVVLRALRVRTTAD
jgi:MFS family permease